MQSSAVRKLVWRQLGIVMLLAMVVSIWVGTINGDHHDIIRVLIKNNLPVLLPQSLILIVILRQVLTFKSAALLIGVRQQSDLIEKQLLLLAILSVSLYFGVYYGSFLLSGNQLFQDGSIVLGCLILGLRFLFLLILAILLIGGYRFFNPGLILVITLLANFIYHYSFEMTYLLIKYAQIYDPVYRAIHHIYMT
ncbi:hypothetical protein HU830_05370 [Lactobacillus sp. DCY120]|uniref:Uncharacterized protein n=1 Tax=Bombilactobacillus apium TaxID=2675299 RepID=A0A850R2L4_9LACO|nr:hypothetical protein [Bombilactobacillus apium]NVY96590.1 hypothetical protein [Bombilactobacillus apium]